MISQKLAGFAGLTKRNFLDNDRIEKPVRFDQRI